MILTFFLKLIQIYQAISRVALPKVCRFYPSCSNYMAEALKTHGVGYGLWLGTKRICKCHPFHPGGVDFVPSGDAVSTSL